MMRKEYVVAQNQHSLGFAEQIFHLRRLWIFLIAFFVYLVSDSLTTAGIAFILLLYFSVKMFILDFKQKEGLLHYFVAYYYAKVFAYILKRLSALIRAFTHMAIFSFAFAQVVPPPPPPPPPPLPPQSQLPSPTELKAEPLTIQEVEALIRRENIKLYVQEGQYHLAPGGHVKLPLRENNLIYFHDTMPALLVFDKEIRDVYILSSVSAFYDERSIFLLGPPQVYGGLAVSFKDGTYAYFTLIKQTDFNLRNFRAEDKKLDQFLQKGKNFPPAPVRKLTTFYYFYTQKPVPLYEVVQAYLKSRTTCPEEELFTYQGITYKVTRVGKEGILRHEGDFFACGIYWRISS